MIECRRKRRNGKRERRERGKRNGKKEGQNVRGREGRRETEGIGEEGMGRKNDKM